MAVIPPKTRPGVNHITGAPDDEKALIERVMADVISFEGSTGRDFKDNILLKYFRQYRGFKAFRDSWTKAGPNDLDGVLYDAKRDWGAHLHIPLSFRTIETLVPRAIAHRPKLLYLPREPKWEENVESVRLMIDSQQEQIDIDLAFQAVMRTGRIYGLGVGKAFWMTDWAKRRRVDRRAFIPGKFFLKDAQWEKVFDDPYFEDVDPFDFMWDPYGSDPRTCDWMVHRTWLSLPKCLDRIAGGAWNTASAKLLDEDKLRSTGDGTKYDDVWQDRMAASGFGGFSLEMRGEQPHEILEWHDGDRVLTVLDRQVLVQDAESPCVGHMPFQVYRPTPLQKQMVGIGDLEPLNHLQRELDTMRSQMTDAVTLALAAGYIYDESAVDEEDLVFGPNRAIAVRNQRPQDAIMPLAQQNLPSGAFNHQATVRQDFDAVSGISDAMNPQDSTASTATEAQLVQASLSARIQLGSRRFELEVVRHVARAFLYLDQRMILENRSPIRQPDEGYDVLQAAQEGRWKWFPQGPGEIQGEFEIIPEGGSMAARNIPQDRQDAQLMLSLAQNPMIDPRRPLIKALELCGITDPTAWLKQGEPPVPPMALQLLAQAGVDPVLLRQAVSNAQQQDPMVAAQGPDVQQVGQMMGSNGNGAQ